MRPLKILIILAFILSLNCDNLLSQNAFKNNSKWELQVAPYVNFPSSTKLEADNGSYIKDIIGYSFSAKILRHFPLKYWENMDITLSCGLNSYPIYNVRHKLNWPSFQDTRYLSYMAIPVNNFDRVSFINYQFQLNYFDPETALEFSLGVGIVSIPGSGDISEPFLKPSQPGIFGVQNGLFISVPPDDIPIIYQFQTTNPFYTPLMFASLGVNKQIVINDLRLNIGLAWVWSFRPLFNGVYYLVEDAFNDVVLSEYGDKYINNIELQIGMPLFKFAKKEK